MIALLNRLRDRLTERRMRKLSDRFVEWYARDEYDEPLEARSDVGEPHEVVEGCLDCPHPDYCAGMGKCEIGAAKLASRTWDDLGREFVEFADDWDERTKGEAT